MSEKTLLTKALFLLVAVLILGMVAILIGVRPEPTYGQVVDRSGSYLAVTGTTATRGEQVLYLINTREQIMIVYKYDTTNRTLSNLATTNLERDFEDAKAFLESEEGAALKRRSRTRYR